MCGNVMLRKGRCEKWPSRYASTGVEESSSTGDLKWRELGYAE
jgi:hypothetical protein